MPMKRRPRILAANSVLPEPQKGSSTTSPRLVKASITGFNDLTGFCVGWYGLPVYCQSSTSGSGKRGLPALPFYKQARLLVLVGQHSPARRIPLNPDQVANG